MSRSSWIENINEQAAKNPSAAAIISKSGTINYHDLVARINVLAALLLERRVTAECPVAICSSRSIDWVVGVLAVLQAGGIYIPIDPMIPMQRKVQMLEDASVKLVLAESSFVTMLPDSIQVAILNAHPQPLGPGSASAEIAAGQAAYGIYTSGSTGVPKNVVICHESLNHYAITLQRELPLTAKDRYLQTASMSFSSSIRQLVAPLVSGAASVIATREEVRDIEILVSSMLQFGVTVLDVVPSYLTRWLDFVSESPRDWRDRLASTLRLVLCASEPLPSQVVVRLRELFPAVRVLNLYGHTETAGAVAMYEVGSAIPDPIPIGNPLGANKFYVLDEKLEPGEKGELYIAGPCLAREYQGREDLTANQFVRNPFTAEFGSRMYRTGDRVRVNDCGQLEFLGRSDDQVKLNGIRIELGEIDALLKSHENVLESATILKLAGNNEMRLVSFVVAHPGKPHPSVEQLKDHLLRFLVDAAIPSAVVFLSELPRTASGKVSRPDLMGFDLNLSSTRASSDLPRTPIEQIVAGCWENLLKINGIGIEDDFFALGGDSLQAIIMVSRLQRLLPIQLPLAAYFFQDPTLEVFAGAIEAELQDANAIEGETQVPVSTQ